MNADFHYYATYSHAESLDIAYSACFVDFCSKTLLSKIKAPLSAATTQLQLELMDARTDAAGLQDITRIWSSFHFLPYNLQARPKRRCSKKYRNKFRLICNPNSALLEETVRLAKGKSLQAAGIAMHVLASTTQTPISMSCCRRARKKSPSATAPPLPTIPRTASTPAAFTITVRTPS